MFTIPKIRKNRRLWKVLVAQQLDTTIEWEDGRAQLQQSHLEKILEGFESVPVEQDEQGKVIESKYNFSYCDFLDDINFEDGVFVGRVDFRDAKFSDQVSFGRVNFRGNVFFGMVEFIGVVNFKGAKFSDKVSFLNADFGREVDFMNAEFSDEVSFFMAKFNGKVDFSGGKFRREVSFSGAKFIREDKQVFFIIAEFSREVDFSGAEFSGEVFFSGVKFIGEDSTVNFKRVKFHREVDFSTNTNWKGAEFCGKGCFYCAEFSSIADFRNTKFKDCDFTNASFNKRAYFNDSTIHTLQLTGVQIDRSLHFLGADIQSANRETARIIKHEFYKLNNHIEAMKWHTREMEEYREELKKIFPKRIREILDSFNGKRYFSKDDSPKLAKNNLEKKQKRKKILTELRSELLTRFVLWFQWTTTRHGSNWLLGIFWILFSNSLIVFGGVSLLAYLDKIYFPTCGDIWYIYANFINPVHSLEIFEVLRSTSINVRSSAQNLSNIADVRGWVSVFDILFRAFNISLIYLTVSAFRRLSRTK